MRREDHRTDDVRLARRALANRLALAGSATLMGFVTALALAGCASAFGLVAAAPADPAVAYENEFAASLHLDSEPQGTWNVETDGPALDLTAEYDASASKADSLSTAVVVDSVTDASQSSGNVRIVHPDDYLGDSTDVGKAFTKAVVDDANSRYSPEAEGSTISFW